jgi:RNA polymerase sigma factor (sigma-70 family)
VKDLDEEEQEVAMESSFSEENEQRNALMEAMFREHYTAVHRYISNKVRQPDVAGDLTSLVFLKAYRWLLEDRGMSKVRSWLYATARTTIADYWQEQQKWFSLPLEMIEDSVSAPFEQLDDEQALERVQRLLHILPTRERQVLYLRYLQGYTAAEVGRELGLSASHVRVLQLRALRHAALLEAEERSFSQMHEPVNEPVTIYTEQGQRVLDLAKEEALSFNHHSIGAEHLLLGILREGSAADSLIERGTTLERVRAGLLFLRGKGQPDPDADLPLTPQSQQLLALAGREAQDRGETAINPQHILHALQSEERGRGVARGTLQLLGVGRLKVQKPPVEESENERTLRQMEQRIEQHPALSPEEEQQLVHMVARGDAEKRRAERLNEAPDHLLVKESQDAYFRLIYASQQLVLSVAQEYFAPERDWRALINAGNIGLTYAISKYGMKTQVPFRTYAAHWIHLEIIEGVLEQ